MLELLAPGGSYEGMAAAVNAGADAVYMGGTRFGARAYAQNPEEKELLAAMDYCHLHGRKLYLTVNTLLKETELEQELYNYLLPAYEHGLDAVLVQDFGVFCFIQKHFPGLALHASTQMTITGVDGARMLKDMGAERIVPSRELSLAEIRQIHREVDIQIECFVHGALCYCYSGQCLMSSLIGGRSGNRGRCAQPCRLPYGLYREGVRQNQERDRYLLSLKDICTLRVLPELIEAGVSSFKIEGRMKRPEYAAGVAEVYRKYIDRYVRKGKRGYAVELEDERRLMDLYNRGGFSGGYYETYNGKSMMTMERPNHWGTPAARVTGGKNGQAHLEALEPLWAGDALEAGLPQKTAPAAGFAGTEVVLREDVPAGNMFTVSVSPRLLRQGQILSRVRCEKLLQELRETYMEREIREKIKGTCILRQGKQAMLTVSWKDRSVTVTGEKPQQAEKRPVEEEAVRRQLMKTGNTPFVFEELEVLLEEKLFYPMQSLNEMRRRALEQLQEKILGEFRRGKPEEMERSGEEDREKPGLPGVYREGPMEADTARREAGEAAEKPELRACVERFEQLEALLDVPEVAGVYLDCCMFLPADEKKDRLTFPQAAKLLHDRKKRCYLMLPMIWRQRVKEAFEAVFSGKVLEAADGFLLRSSEQMEYFQRMEAEAPADLSGGFLKNTEMIADAGIYTYNREARRFLEKFGISRDTLPLECNRRELAQRGCRGSEAIVYGYLPLMVTAQCLVKNTAGCRHTPGVLHLRDRKNTEFPVRNQCSICTNVIYNSVPLDLTGCSRELLQLNPASCRLVFTFESRGEVKRIAAEAAGCFLRGEPVKWAASGTKGHFKRGVE